MAVIRRSEAYLHHRGPPVVLDRFRERGHARGVEKKRLIQAIIDHLEQDLAGLKSAAMESYEAATGEESRPENEYDTRALEASYLAGAQSKRVAEVEEALHIYRHLEVRQYTDKTPIGPTALVDVECEGKPHRVFITPASGGLTVLFEGHSVQVVTPKSPLGEALVGLSVGDVATIDKGNKTLEYDILTVA